MRANDPRGESVNIKAIGWIAVSLIAGAVVMHLVLIWMFGLYGQGRPGAHKLSMTIPQPPLEIDSGALLATIRAEEDKRLQKLEWIDRENGVICLPIERAMEAVVRGGTNAK